jgi:hypothetical protein
VFAAVLIVSVTAAGDADVGWTGADGTKLQEAPAGNPLQLKVTASENDP